jgi:hypothetical protein
MMDNARLEQASQAYKTATAAASAQYAIDRNFQAMSDAKQTASAAYLAEKNAVYAPVDAMLDRIDDDDSPVS